MKVDVLGTLVELRAEQTDLDFAQARDLARAEARRIDPQAMLLSWHSGLTGEYHPKIECGQHKQPPWIVWAASRGANLTVSINDGAYCFYYLIEVLAERRPHRDSRSKP
jgi:hypothetical protein